MLVQGLNLCGSSMAASPSTPGRFRAATCRRWGDVGALSRVARREARRYYFARVAKRSLRDRRPVLPLCGSPAAAAEHAAGPASPREVPRRGSSRTRERGPAQAIPRSVGGMLCVCPSFIAAAEVKAAPAFFVDFTDGGTVSVEDFARRLCWSTPERARQANVLARTVDVAEASRLRERSQRAWDCLICSLVTFYMVEVNSTFRRAYWAAVERGVFFPAVPLRGRFGWRARAHWMGLL